LFVPRHPRVPFRPDDERQDGRGKRRVLASAGEVVGRRDRITRFLLGLKQIRQRNAHMSRKLDHPPWVQAAVIRRS